jgi:hypothetical protein
MEQGSYFGLGQYDGVPTDTLPLTHNGDQSMVRGTLLSPIPLTPEQTSPAHSSANSCGKRRGSTLVRSNSFSNPKRIRWEPLPTPESLEAPTPSRPSSPLFLSDVFFREALLVDYFFAHNFRHQVRNAALGGEGLDRKDVIPWIESNDALRHAVCALALITYPGLSPLKPSKEGMTHLGMALTFLRRDLREGRLDEGLLFAVMQLVELEVSTPAECTHIRGPRGISRNGESIWTLPSRSLGICRLYRTSWP